MSTVIKVENLSKYYRLGLIGGKTLHDDLNRWWARMRKQPDPLLKIGQEDRSNGNGEYIWALRDINFEVQQGEIVGIIGRNGAGKSTLLKILSRITAPTSGQVKVKGRIASLLEVGTGFHPELTGRENIYLNGAILGMKKAEIDRKFDEIVAFAEVEKFIDTPVKRYSSGMYVRLAFAVAAHLEPEILVVDEVLAVGDAEFQKKCLGKMGEVAKEGRTVLFVSHNMPSVQRLTVRSILLKSGSLLLDAHTAEVIDYYLSSTEQIAVHPTVDLRHHPGRLPGMTSALTRMWITEPNGDTITSVPMGGEITIHVEYETDSTVRQPIVGLVFESLQGDRIFSINNKMAPGAVVTNTNSKGILACHIPQIPLVSGDYFVTVTFAKSVDADIDRVERAYKLSVAPFDVYKTGYIPVREQGACILFGSWEFHANHFVSASDKVNQRVNGHRLK